MKSDCSMISIIKQLVWHELIMISSIDLCGDTKLSKVFNKDLAEQMVNKTSTHQICFNILNNYDIFGHNLLSIKKKKLASKFEYFPDFSIHVELFILRRKVQSKKRLQPCSLLNVCPQQEDFENRIVYLLHKILGGQYKCVSMGDLNCSVTVYFWLCCYGGM